MAVTTKFLFLTLLVYITATIILFRVDPTGHYLGGQSTSVALTFSGIGVLVLLIFMGIKKNIVIEGTDLTSENVWSITKVILYMVVGLGIFIGIISGFMALLGNPPTSSAIFSILNIIIFMVTILLLLYFLKDIEIENSYFNLVKNIILYIPCLVYDTIDWLKYQYRITTSTAWILLGLDVFVILLQKLITYIQQFIKHNKVGNTLLEGPIYLNNLSVVGSFEDLKAAMKNKNFSYNYGLSFSIYINPQPPSTSAAYGEYTTLFDYGGKPTLLYKADENKLKIQIMMNNEEKKDIYLGTSIKLQKWNDFVINYDGGTLDVILNGKLISSTGSIAPYMTLDVVSVGQNHGIHGGIKEVIYFRKPLI